MFEKVKEKTKKYLKKINKHYLILFIIVLGVFSPYLSGSFIKGDDFVPHMSNMYAMDKAIGLKNGTIFPSKIRSIIANDLGYGNGIFYPQFSYLVTVYIYKIIKIGFSLITAVKIYQFLLVYLSGIFMYKFVNETFKNKSAGLVSAIMYVTAPYFLTDVFNRMAYAEMAVFLFMPIVMLSITHIFNKNYKKFLMYFVIGYCGMICSHLVITVYFTILLAIILIINIKQIWNKKTILYFIFGTILVLGITSPFTIPMLEHKIGGNYTVFQDGAMANISGLMKRRLELSNIISQYGKVYSVYTYINIAVLAFATLTVFSTKKIAKDSKQKNMLYTLYVFTILAFLIGSKLIDWNKMPKILWEIQFPWRICTYITFGISAIAGISITLFKKNTKKLAIILICMVCITDANYITHVNKYENVNSISKETVETSSGAMGLSREYLPVKVKENLEYFNNRNQDIIIKKGSAETNIIENKTPYLQFKINIETNNEEVKLELPRIYYMGYEIKLKTSDGNEEKIDYYENENGFMEFGINKSGIIIIDYKGTTLNKIANIISILMIIIYLIFVFVKKKR